MRIARLTFLVALGLFAAGGCHDPADLGPTGTISGTLTYQGKPLTPGTQVLFFNPERGFAGLGQTDAEGHFAITFFRKETGKTPQMPVGKYILFLQPPPNSASEDAKEAPVDPSAGLLPGEMAAANQKSRITPSEFPAKYRQPYTSDVSREVVEGENTFTIDLK